MKQDEWKIRILFICFFIIIIIIIIIIICPFFSLGNIIY